MEKRRCLILSTETKKMPRGMRFSLCVDTDMENDFVGLGWGCHVQSFLGSMGWMTVAP